MPLIEISAELECPHCGTPDWHDVDALVGSGPIPQTHIVCYLCKGQFKAEASADIDVSPVGVSPDA